MPIVAVFEGMTREQYEESVRRITGGRDRMTSIADWPAPGLIAHIAGDTAGGFRVIDVWESMEAFERFGEHLMPLLQDLGVQGAPDIRPTHTVVV
jgi:hypothetical protein